jgi:hypothetical protein
MAILGKSKKSQQKVVPELELPPEQPEIEDDEGGNNDDDVDTILKDDAGDSGGENVGDDEEKDRDDQKEEDKNDQKKGDGFVDERAEDHSAKSKKEIAKLPGRRKRRKPNGSKIVVAALNPADLAFSRLDEVSSYLWI